MAAWKCLFLTNRSPENSVIKPFCCQAGDSTRCLQLLHPFDGAPAAKCNAVDSVTKRAETDSEKRDFWRNKTKMSTFDEQMSRKKK